MNDGWVIALASIVCIGVPVFVMVVALWWDERKYYGRDRHSRREGKAYAERKAWDDQINYWYDARRNGSPMEKLIADDMVEYLKDMRDKR